MIAPTFPIPNLQVKFEIYKIRVCTLINEIFKVLIWNSIMFGLRITDHHESEFDRKDQKASAKYRNII